MATSKEYLNFVLDQLSWSGEISHRAMMGEYVIYYRGKVVGGIYDDRFLVKPTNSAVAMMKDVRWELPYKGAKEMLLVDDIENREFLQKLLEAMYEELPFPKKKKKSGADKGDRRAESRDAMITEEIQKELFRLQDEKYRDFQSKLIPTVEFDAMIGVRTPELRKYAKQLIKREDIGDFLEKLPHRYFDENQLHAFLISEMKDFVCCIKEVCRFLPCIDNWATCDQLSPKVFKKHRKELLSYIREWLSFGQTYTVRFAVGMLMEHFLDEDFDASYLTMAAEIKSEEYYINMMTAWYFATALAKQYEAAIPFLEEKKLERWTHNKAIQKAIESRRITPEQKEYLRSLKIPK